MFNKREEIFSQSRSRNSSQPHPNHHPFFNKSPSHPSKPRQMTPETASQQPKLLTSRLRGKSVRLCDLNFLEFSIQPHEVKKIFLSQVTFPRSFLLFRKKITKQNQA